MEWGVISNFNRNFNLLFKLTGWHRKIHFQYSNYQKVRGLSLMVFFIEIVIYGL